MSDLTQFRDYCRRMAADGKRVIPWTKAERALWLMLASEVDAYIDGDHDVVAMPEPDDQQLTLGDA